MTTKRKTTSRLTRRPSSSPIIGKDEVGVRVGQVEHFLPAVAEPKSFDSATAPRDERLQLLQASALLVELRIHESGQPPHPFGHRRGDEKNSADAECREARRAKSALVPATNIMTKVVAPMSAVVPRSTSTDNEREQNADDAAAE